MFYAVHLAYSDGIHSQRIICITKACDTEDAEENIKRAYPDCSIEQIAPWNFRSTNIIEVAKIKYI